MSFSTSVTPFIAPSACLTFSGAPCSRRVFLAVDEDPAKDSEFRCYPNDMSGRNGLGVAANGSSHTNTRDIDMTITTASRRTALTGAALALGLVTLAPTAASAAPPVEPDPLVITDTGIDPCTGEPHDITVVVQEKLLINNRQFVSVDKSTVTTSDDYSGRGTLTFKVGNGMLRINGMSVLENDEGSKFSLQARVVVDLDTGVEVDDSTLRCIRK